jgi:hypothetical protein
MDLQEITIQLLTFTSIRDAAFKVAFAAYSVLEKNSPDDQKSLVNVLFPACFSLASLFAASPSKAQSPINIPVAPEISGSPEPTAIETSKSEEIVMMELWGIQISSSDPARLSTVMDQVNREIDETRRAMQYAYEDLLEASRKIDTTWIENINTRWIENNDTEKNARMIAWNTGLSGMPRISLADALFRINMANDASSIYKAMPCYKSNDPLAKDQCAITPQFAKQIETYNNAATNLWAPRKFQSRLDSGGIIAIITQ